MAEVIDVMDIDDENGNINSGKPNIKGKNVVVSAAPPDSRATPWVEKYRPQSLDDVAAHRDIVETSKLRLHYSTCSSSAFRRTIGRLSL